MFVLPLIAPSTVRPAARRRETAADRQPRQDRSRGDRQDRDEDRGPLLDLLRQDAALSERVLLGLSDPGAAERRAPCRAAYGGPAISDPLPSTLDIRR